MKKYGQVLVALGMQWGDEGKGKIVDIVSPEYDLVIRANGGANAGHTIKFKKDGEDKKIVFHQLPSGMTNEKSLCLIANGCVVDFVGLEKEIENFSNLGVEIEKKLRISDRAQLVFGFHKKVDAFLEDYKKQGKIGTTLRGIGPAYADKIYRHNLRAGDLKNWDSFEKMYWNEKSMIEQIWGLSDYNWQEELEYFKKISQKYSNLIVNTQQLISNFYKEGKKILIEGANGVLLDIDHGTYPYVTSSNVIVSGLCTGCGLAPQKITDVLGILKAYTTRVGEGPFPTEQKNTIGEKMQNNGAEFGSTTGRGRRCGWFDAVVARYACELNGINSINLTKIDVLDDFENINICTGYKLDGKEIDFFPSSISDLEKIEPIYETLPGWMESISEIDSYEKLPENCKKYIDKIEELLGVPIHIVNTGASRHQIVFK